MRFEWDPKKAASNTAKHGVTFEEATEVFEPGVEVMEIEDVEHSDTEDRFWTIGPISRGIVVVVWTERTEDTISARFANQAESARFRKYLRGTS